MQIEYKKFQIKDTNLLTEFIFSFYEEDGDSNKPMTQEKINKTISQLTSHPELGDILMITLDGKKIGYSILINYWDNEYGGNFIILDELYIIPEYRNRRIGTDFINFILQSKINSSLGVKIKTTQENIGAKKLYERLGFIKDTDYHLTYIKK